MTTPEPRRERGAGFSLAEVVVALGLLAGVLLSVAGLLVIGSRQVRGGRSSSEALAVARDVLEDMRTWSFDDVTRRFVADCDITQPVCAVDSTTSAAAAAWQADLRGRLAGSRASIELVALDAGSLADAATLRVTVTVFWPEGPRSRRVALATVRT
jgi:type II secretory pathway pseudopilin PulG